MNLLLLSIMFNIATIHKDRTLEIKPMFTPTFLVEQAKGQPPQPGEFVNCTAATRDFADLKDGKHVTLLVLKCGKEQEFIIKSVEFEDNNR